MSGGQNYGNQLVKYDITTDTFIDYSDSAIPVYTTGYGQYYTQRNDVIYMIDNLKLSAFNINTEVFQSHWNNINIPIVSHGACLASNDDYLFIVGGYGSAKSNKLQVLDISSQIWLNGISTMDKSREWLSCIVHPTNNELFAIGGSHNQTKTLDTIERLLIGSNINTATWQYNTYNLLFPAEGQRTLRKYWKIFIENKIEM